MSDRQYSEKEEKDVEKREEKGEEKSWEEKWHRDPLGTAAWAVILIWAGLVLLADNLGLLASFEILDAWGLILVGAGVILLLQVVVRLLVPDYRQPVTGTIILGVVLLAIGLGDLFSWSVIWPLVLIAIGASILLRGLIRRR